MTQDPLPSSSCLIFNFRLVVVLTPSCDLTQTAPLEESIRHTSPTRRPTPTYLAFYEPRQRKRIKMKKLNRREHQIKNYSWEVLRTRASLHLLFFVIIIFFYFFYFFVLMEINSVVISGCGTSVAIFHVSVKCWCM